MSGSLQQVAVGELNSHLVLLLITTMLLWVVEIEKDVLLVCIVDKRDEKLNDMNGICEVT
jgi:hypothetical protein